MSEDYTEVVNAYQSDFFNRSGGFRLPDISFVCEWNNPTSLCTPVTTISLPVCNQQRLIGSILESIFSEIEIPSMIVIVLDNCRDDSFGEISEFLAALNPEKTNVSTVLIFETTQDIFESSCDNFALTLCKTDYFISCQADNFLNDSTFVSRAISAMEAYGDLAGISARGVVPFDHPRRKPHKNSVLRQVANLPSRLFPGVFRFTFLGPFRDKFRFFGDVSAPPSTWMRYSRTSKRHIFLGEAIVRGPIIWRTESLKGIGGFNDVGYFLGWDDYDVSLRLLDNLHQRVGFMPSGCFSLVNTGTNSFPRSPDTQIEYKKRELLASKFQGKITDYWNMRDSGARVRVVPWEKRIIRKLEGPSCSIQ